VRSGIADTGETRLDHHRNAGGEQNHGRENQDKKHRELHLAPFNFLTGVLRRPPDHQTRDKDRQHRHHEHPIKTRADAAEDDLAELDVYQRHEAAERRERIVHGVDRAAGGVRRDGGKERRLEGSEPDLLAFQIYGQRGPSLGIGLDPGADRLQRHIVAPEHAALEQQRKPFLAAHLARPSKPLEQRSSEEPLDQGGDGGRECGGWGGYCGLSELQHMPWVRRPKSFS